MEQGGLPTDQGSEVETSTKAWKEGPGSSSGSVTEYELSQEHVYTFWCDPGYHGDDYKIG